MTFSTSNGWHRLSRLVLSLSILLLTACGLTGPFPGVPDFVSASSIPVYTGPVAAPQVGYRIDDNRYFEIVPNRAAACSDASIYYRDDARGIRSFVMPLRNLGGVDLVIDAANDQYLVAPADKGSGNCSSGGGICPGPGLIYSDDAGRSWKRGEAWDSSDDINLVGSHVYSIGQRRLAKRFDLVFGSPGRADWKYDPGYRLNLQKPPVDRRFHCDRNEKGEK